MARRRIESTTYGYLMAGTPIAIGEGMNKPPRGNLTRFRSLDKLGGQDPRISFIEDEGRISDGGDGLWAYTSPGYCNGDIGSHIIHENTVAEVLRAARDIRQCSCTDCQAHSRQTMTATTHCAGVDFAGCTCGVCHKLILAGERITAGLGGHDPRHLACELNFTPAHSRATERTER